MHLHTLCEAIIKYPTRSHLWAQNGHRKKWFTGITTITHRLSRRVTKPACCARRVTPLSHCKTRYLRSPVRSSPSRTLARWITIWFWTTPKTACRLVSVLLFTATCVTASGVHWKIRWSKCGKPTQGAVTAIKRISTWPPSTPTLAAVAAWWRMKTAITSSAPSSPGRIHGAIRSATGDHRISTSRFLVKPLLSAWLHKCTLKAIR